MLYNIFQGMRPNKHSFKGILNNLKTEGVNKC